MSDDAPVLLFRDRVIRGQMTMEHYARELTRMDGTAPRGPCLGPDQGARRPAVRERGPVAQSLFDDEGAA